MNLAAPSSTTPAGTTPATPAAAAGGVLGSFADGLRDLGTGYQSVTAHTSVVAEKAAIHPFETVVTATGLLRDVTKKVPMVNKATSLLHTIGGFAMLIGTSSLTAGLRAPGDTAVDISHRLADVIDGKNTAPGWSLGWGVVTDAATGETKPATQSGLGAALVAAGMR